MTIYAREKPCGRRALAPAWHWTVLHHRADPPAVTVADVSGVLQMTYNKDACMMEAIGDYRGLKLGNIPSKLFGLIAEGRHGVVCCMEI